MLWISILEPLKRVLKVHKTLIVKLPKDALLDKKKQEAMNVTTKKKAFKSIAHVAVPRAYAS